MIRRRSFITGLKSTKLSDREKFFLKNYQPWGVILFSRNIRDFNQVSKLTTSIRDIFNDKNYPILIDQEGGRVNRLSNLISVEGFTSEFFGNKYIKDKKEFRLLFKLFIDKTSHILRILGLNINTVPVLDLNVKGASNIIGNRSFSNNPKIVSEIGDLCLKIYQENKIGCIIKHIPGHGLSKVDSHHFTPRISKNKNFLFKNDFFPFKKKKAFFAMTAHVIFDKIDSKNTATHSKKMIDLIRNKLGFRNLIISDDLCMKSLKGSLKEKTVKTFRAGCNLALHCNGNLKEMRIVGNNSPYINKFIIKKTSQFYKILS